VLIVGHHRGRDEGHGRHQYFVTGPNIEKLQRDMERRGRGIHRHRVLRADLPREGVLELFGHRPETDPSRPQHLNHGLLFAFVI
jgi:hypothetical protein